MAGIYLHIPFCKKRCIYCDFYSTTQQTKQQPFVEALQKEIAMRKDYLKNEQVSTIYLGGGTPSQLPYDQLAQIFETIFTNYSVSPDAEITLEANPDDLETTYITHLRHLPINRISMGVQSFDDTMLRFLNRRHDAQTAIKAYNECLDAGFTNISIDLIYGLPKQCITQWENDLNQALALHPTHFSAYHLTYEEKTPLWKLREHRKITEVSEEDSLLFFRTLISYMKEAGYQHYEISNFALPGFQSQHNSNYWKQIPYLGCGPSAHSFNTNSRQWNIADLETYLQSINHNELPTETEILDEETLYNECILTAIRTMEGLNLTSLLDKYGQVYLDYCLNQAAPYLEKGLLERTPTHLRLTQEGIFLSDGIITDLFKIS